MHTFHFAVVCLPCHIYIELFIYSLHCIIKLLNTLFYYITRKALVQVPYTVVISTVLSRPPFLPTSWEALLCVLNEKISEDLGSNQSFQLNIECKSNNCTVIQNLPDLSKHLQNWKYQEKFKLLYFFLYFSLMSPLDHSCILVFLHLCHSSLLEKKKDVLWEKQLLLHVVVKDPLNYSIHPVSDTTALGLIQHSNFKFCLMASFTWYIPKPCQHFENVFFGVLDCSY